MKQGFLVLVLSVACVAGVFAQETYATNGMLVAPGDMALTGGFDFGLGVNAGYEMAFGKFNMSDLTFSYGAKAIAGLNFLPGGMALLVGGVGTLHFSWACIDLPENLRWIQNIDTFLGIGVGYSGATASFGSAGGIGLISHGGSSYFFSPNLAVTVAGGVGGSYIGLLLKM